jgi:hypothetical protein
VYRATFSSWRHVKDPDTGLLNPATAAMEADATAAIADLQSASTFAAGAALLQVDESADHLTAQPTHVEFARSDFVLGATGAVTVTENHPMNTLPTNSTYTPVLSSVTNDAVTSPIITTTDVSGNQLLVIPAGETVELDSAYSGTISFAGGTGTLKIDHSSSFSGTIAGQLAIGDVIDLADITAGANAHISYSGNNSPGTLSVSDGTHIANIALDGIYSLANFTASSDGHGGTLVIDPPLLPDGVTLKAVDGGPTYYTDHGFTSAAAAGWDSPNFFPIGPWFDMLITQSDANRWHDLGWNTAFVTTANSSMAVARTNGISVVQDGTQSLLSGSGSETVGLLSADENYNDSVNSVHQTANSIQGNQFWWLQNTWSVLGYGDIGGTPMAQIMSQPLTTPDGTTRHFDTVTADTYWFTGSKDGGMLWQWGQIYDLGRPMTEDEGARGSNYGDMIDILRSYETTYPAPIAQFIETGEPGNAGTDADYITPPELNWATWSSIIHGAREIIYFNHTFTGSNQSQDNVAQPFYQTVQPGQTVSIYDQVKATDGLIAQLAPVINSPFAMNYVTVNGSHYSYGTPDLALGGLEVMAKDYNGQFYIFADTRESESRTNIPATFTIADKTATSVTVVNENRTIAVVNGVFSDTFATAATVHIYAVNGSGSGTPGSTAPGAPTIASFSMDSNIPGDFITNDSTVSLHGAAAANSTVKFFDGSAEIGTTTATANGSWDYITAVLTDAKHTLTATATNSAGQSSAASSALAVTVDTILPNAPTIASPASAGNNTFLLKGTAEAQSEVQVFEGATKIGSVTADSTGAWSFTTGALSSGSHNITTKAMDVAGNLSPASAAVSATVGQPGTQPPASVPTISSFSTDTGKADDGITSDNTPTLTGTAAANSTVKVFDGATEIGSVTANGTGGWTLTPSALADGNHNLVGATASAASAALTIKVDTLAPDAPVLSKDSVVNTNQVLLTGTAEANSFVKVYDGATVVGTVTTDGNGDWTITSAALKNGSHNLTATATDVAGNTSPMSKPLDPVVGPDAPDAPMIGSLSRDTGKKGDGITRDNTLTLTGTADANSTVQVFDGDTQIGTATSDGSGTWKYTTAALADGEHSLTAKEVDASGQAGPASLPAAVTIDTHAPAAPATAAYTQHGTAVHGTTAAHELVLNGTAEANSTVHVLDNGRQIGSTNANGSGDWSLDTGHLWDGSHSFASKAVDAAGNVSAASVATDVTVDAPESTPALNIHQHCDHTVTIRGTAEAYSHIKVYDGNTSVGTASTKADGSWSFGACAVSKSMHTYTAQELDDSGHVLASSGSAILGSRGNNTLESTAGDDLLVGHGGHDSFVFQPNFGHDVIKDFAASGRGQDAVQFSKSVFDNYADVLAHATQSGHDAVIAASAVDSLTLKNVKVTALEKTDFHFA